MPNVYLKSNNYQIFNKNNKQMDNISKLILLYITFFTVTSNFNFILNNLCNMHYVGTYFNNVLPKLDLHVFILN